MLCKLQTHRTDKFVVIYPARLEGVSVLYRNLVASFFYIRNSPWNIANVFTLTKTNQVTSHFSHNS